MSIASQCSDCCTCPDGSFSYYPRISVSYSFVSTYSESAYLCGFEPYEEQETCVRYRTKTISAEFEDPNSSCEYDRRYVYTGAAVYGEGGCSITQYAKFNSFRKDPPDCEETPIVVDGDVTQIENLSVDVQDPPCAAGKQTTGVITSATVFTVTGCDFTGSGTETLSDPDTVEAAILRADDPTTGTSQCAFTGEQTDCSFGDSQTTTGTFTVTGEADTSYTIRICVRTYPTDDQTDYEDSCEDVSVTTDGDGIAEFEYTLPQPEPGFTSCFLSAAAASDSYVIQFSKPQFSVGCLRATWVERAQIGESGVSLTSIEVVHPGVYRPAISFSGGGGSGATAVAVMSSTGTVSSIRILNPGSGYTSAPTVTIATATNGGTTATATATISGGQVTSISVGTAGNYLPAISFAGGGGTSAAASCTMDAQGGISTITLSNTGSGYTAEPSVEITAKSSGTVEGLAVVHLGTETSRCASWDKVLPEDYDPEDETTWPYVGPYELPTGATIANIQTFCDCSSCP